MQGHYSSKEKINISFIQALIPVLIMALLILLSVVIWKVPIHLALFLEIFFTASLALFWGISWDDLERMLFSGFSDIGRVIIILLLIGMVIGCWIEIGTVPSMIYFGINLINPAYFLVLVFIITSLVSMAIGTAFGTASTVGLALISIARGLGLPLPLVAGAIISGSYVGDRMSPVSSIANLTAFSAGVEIHELTRYLFKTVIPPYLVTLFLSLIAGIYYFPEKSGAGQTAVLTETLSANFPVSLWLLLPPLLIIILSLLKVPTIPNLAISLFVSLFSGIVFGHKPGLLILKSMYFGYQGNTGVNFIDELLSRGGMAGMLELIAMIILAVLLGGLFEELGILEVLLKTLAKKINGKNKLVFITMVSSIITAVLGCNQLLAVYLPGKMLVKRYRQDKVPLKVLGRALADSGLIISPLIPWNINGIMMAGILGVSTIGYIPFAFLPLLLPLSSFLFNLKEKHIINDRAAC